MEFKTCSSDNQFKNRHKFLPRNISGVHKRRREYMDEPNNKMICTGSWLLSYCSKNEMHYFNTQAGYVRRLI